MVYWLGVVIVVVVSAVTASEGLGFEERLHITRFSTVVDSLTLSWEVDGMDV